MKANKNKNALGVIPQDIIRGSIYLIRSQKVILDVDLAALYRVETKVLNQAVRRNKERFPEDFMFRLSKEEFDILRSQIVTSSSEWGGRRYLPYAFTENGVAMLSGVLNSPRAIRVNIAIMRTFTKLREIIAANKHLERRVGHLEARVSKVFDLLADSSEYAPKRKKLGF